LTSRYGAQYEDVQRHLDNAKTWHENAKQQSDKIVPGQLQQKQSEFESKMGEAGSALARREKRIKQLLKELWQTVTKDNY
jgi:hypothetical protein